MHGEERQASFLSSQLAVHLVAQGNSTKEATMLNSIYGRLKAVSADGDQGQEPEANFFRQSSILLRNLLINGKNQA